MYALKLAGPVLFLSTLSLRRATRLCTILYSCPGNFYPRSPCGERQPTTGRHNKNNIFLSTLSLRRATQLVKADTGKHLISIHALLAESDDTVSKLNRPEEQFLSTLSLRRATVGQNRLRQKFAISIHALLAESDDHHSENCQAMQGFLSTLSLRRATAYTTTIITCIASFLSTLSLRRAT